MASKQWVECIEPRLQAECMKWYEELVQKLAESFRIPKDIAIGIDGPYSSTRAALEHYNHYHPV